MPVKPEQKKLPIGHQDFADLIKNPDGEQFYYVDKTMIIQELMDTQATVNLMLRPRRFGKSLALNMMREFFRIDGDPTLFNGLKISQNTDLCTKYHCQYPVLFLDLKSIAGNTAMEAIALLTTLLEDTAEKLSFLADSPRLSKTAKKNFETILSLHTLDRDTEEEEATFRSTLISAPVRLTSMLHEHYGKKVMVLIDEYDAPLNNAYNKGFYDQMVDLIRSIFDKLLKGNDHLRMAFLTGCLRVSKESIFTGMNNLYVWQDQLDFDRDYFGFTEPELSEMLAYYGIPEALPDMRDWYDGFQFSEGHVYCPWDVLNHVRQCLKPRNDRTPLNHWGNTSENAILKKLLSSADKDEQEDYVSVMTGGSIWKPVIRELTYPDLDSSSDALWSVMVASGYLAIRSRDGELCELTAPNREVRWLLSDSLQKYLCSNHDVSQKELLQFSAALPRGDTATIERCLGSILENMLHIHAAAQSSKRRESLYQGILLGLLRHRWLVEAELEAGYGYIDVWFPTSPGQAVILEVKDSGTADLDTACQAAMKQIRDRNYAEGMRKKGAVSVLQYGIAFKGAECRVLLER